jgi:hypothetical protein
VGEAVDGERGEGGPGHGRRLRAVELGDEFDPEESNGLVVARGCGVLAADIPDSVAGNVDMLDWQARLGLDLVLGFDGRGGL